MRKSEKLIAQSALKVTKWIGSSQSVMIHSLLFILSFIVPYTKIVTFERMLLFVTTIVSLEAIYLSIFIQMSINMNIQHTEEIHESIETIGESIDEIGETVDEMHDDDEMTENDKVLRNINLTLISLQREIELLKKTSR